MISSAGRVRSAAPQQRPGRAENRTVPKRGPCRKEDVPTNDCVRPTASARRKEQIEKLPNRRDGVVFMTSWPQRCRSARHRRHALRESTTTLWFLSYWLARHGEQFAESRFRRPSTSQSRGSPAAWLARLDLFSQTRAAPTRMPKL